MIFAIIIFIEEGDEYLSRKVKRKK